MLKNTINRAVITIGVAYGSDTEKTLELRHKVAHEHPSVMEDPAPIAVFDSFGDHDDTK